MSKISNLYWKLWKSYENPGCLEIFRELELERSLTAEQWRTKNERRLREQLRYASEHIPFYQSTFEQSGLDIDSDNWRENFENVPILTKQIVRDNMSSLRNVAIKDTYKNSTGGSTGQPLHFYQDESYRKASVALDAHVRKGWGIGPVEKTANIWGADIDFRDQSFRKKFYDWRSRTRGLNAFKMSRRELVEFLSMLQRWKPPYLVGYASALNVLAEAALDEGIEGLHFKAVRSSAEKLYPHHRNTIERAFQSPVFDFYGSREVNNIAGECTECHAMHLVSTLRFIEITDEQGRVVEPGVPGFVTVTDLTNRAMPMIRYRNDDMAAFAKSPCACGRPAPVLESLLGRTTDMIRSAKGDLIHGEFFTHLFYDLPIVREFQVRQTNLEKISIAYVGLSPLADKEKQSLRLRIQDKMGQGTCVEFSRCDSIPRLSSGKHRFTICELDP